VTGLGTNVLGAEVSLTTPELNQRVSFWSNQAAPLALAPKLGEASTFVVVGSVFSYQDKPCEGKVQIFVERVDKAASVKPPRTTTVPVVSDWVKEGNTTAAGKSKELLLQVRVRRSN